MQFKIKLFLFFILSGDHILWSNASHGLEVGGSGDSVGLWSLLSHARPRADVERKVFSLRRLRQHRGEQKIRGIHRWTHKVRFLKYLFK